jgi:hypothetical protein
MYMDDGMENIHVFGIHNKTMVWALVLLQCGNYS